MRKHDPYCLQALPLQMVTFFFFNSRFKIKSTRLKAKVLTGYLQAQGFAGWLKAQGRSGCLEVQGLPGWFDAQGPTWWPSTDEPSHFSGFEFFSQSAGSSWKISSIVCENLPWSAQQHVPNLHCKPYTSVWSHSSSFSSSAWSKRVCTSTQSHSSTFLRIWQTHRIIKYIRPDSAVGFW